jgi:glucose dehydrogenase
MERDSGLAAMGKSGWMFILDRVTGKPVFGVEERPFPRGRSRRMVFARAAFR